MDWLYSVCLLLLAVCSFGLTFNALLLLKIRRMLTALAIQRMAATPVEAQFVGDWRQMPPEAQAALRTGLTDLLADMKAGDN